MLAFHRRLPARSPQCPAAVGRRHAGLDRRSGWFRGHKLNYPWSSPTGFPKGFPFSRVPGLPHENDWGVLPGKAQSEYDDARTADFAIDVLHRSHDKPFFLAAVFFHPHLPWYAPRKYFEQYPLDQVQHPPTKEDDLDDVPGPGQKLAAARCSDYDKIRLAGKWEEAIAAYLASISFADSQLGRVLDGLDSSDYEDGSEELYDHRQDPHEWDNLADDEQFGRIKRELAQWIPSEHAPPAPAKSAYLFDPATYSWTKPEKSGNDVSSRTKND